MLRTFLEIVATVWLCIQIGEQIERRVPNLGENELFWPLWVTVFSLVLAIVFIVDVLIKSRNSKAESRSAGGIE